MKAVFLPLLATSLLVAGPANAQDNGVGKRVERLEKEMRAVQRKVFTGGSTFFEADIKPDAAKASGSSTTTSAVTDLIARVDSLERSLAGLTGKVEKNEFRLKNIEDKLATLGSTTALSTPTATVTPTAIVDPKPTPNETAEQARIAGVKSIVKPDTGDAGEDSYIYGYRLWEAKYYPEAQTQLKKTFEEHPNHRRASFAQNLLGRAYLDDSKPALASVALYENYQKRPRGERASDSLYFLSTALVQLDKKDDACRVLAELQDVYPDQASGRLSSRVASGKSAANCK